MRSSATPFVSPLFFGFCPLQPFSNLLLSNPVNLPPNGAVKSPRDSMLGLQGDPCSAFKGDLFLKIVVELLWQQIWLVGTQPTGFHGTGLSMRMRLHGFGSPRGVAIYDSYGFS